MPMAPPQSVFLRLLLLLPVFAAAFVASLVQDQAPSDAAADKFLRECCANTTDAAVCYDSLLPRAGSFEGNFVKVAGAATFIAYARLRDNELRSFLRGGTGAGEDVIRALKYCMEYFADVLYREDDALAILRRLETAAGRGEHSAKSDLNTVNLDIGGMHFTIDVCTDDFASSGGGVLASPVGKMMLAGNATVHLHAAIALDLVVSIKL